MLTNFPFLKRKDKPTRFQKLKNLTTEQLKISQFSTLIYYALLEILFSRVEFGTWDSIQLSRVGQLPGNGGEFDTINIFNWCTRNLSCIPQKKYRNKVADIQWRTCSVSLLLSSQILGPLAG